MSIVPRDPWDPITADMRNELRAAWPDGERLTIAWKLALDLDTLADLLAGRALSPDRLDQDALFDARRKTLVRLVAPAELLEGVA